MDIYKERIRPLFDSTGKTGAELEILIGLPEKIISNWDKGRVKSYKNYAAQIAKYFKVDSDYILGKTDDPTPLGAERQPPAQGGGLSEKDVRLIAWFRSLPPETREAILTLGGGPKDLAD